MKIVLSTFGSRGDVQPMLALTLGLQAAGHQVLLIGPPEEAAWAAELGCPYQGVGKDISALIATADAAHTARSGKIFLRYMRQELATQFEVLPDLVQGADIVVGASMSYSLASMAEAFQIPYRSIAFTPQVIPSGFHPSPNFRRQGMPQWYNWAGWGLARLMGCIYINRMINAHRRKMGLLPIKSLLTHMMGARVTVASDAAVATVPPDVKIKFTQTGYMHLDQPEQHMPRLEEYLAAGTRPVYVGFGSMPPRDQARLVPLIVSAARAAGRRVVILKFWQVPQAGEYGDDVFFIHKYPHRRLFPKMAAVVHHGGAGTTATAAISGVPQVVVPHVFDQYYWGDRIRRAGLGPPPLWRSKLTAAGLAKAIRDCTEKQSYGQKAGLVGETIRQVNGVEQTMQAILAA